MSDAGLGAVATSECGVRAAAGAARGARGARVIRAGRAVAAAAARAGAPRGAGVTCRRATCAAAGPRPPSAWGPRLLKRLYLF